MALSSLAERQQKIQDTINSDAYRKTLANDVSLMAGGGALKGLVGLASKAAKAAVPVVTSAASRVTSAAKTGLSKLSQLPGGKIVKPAAAATGVVGAGYALNEIAKNYRSGNTPETPPSTPDNTQPYGPTPPNKIDQLLSGGSGGGVSKEERQLLKTIGDDWGDVGGSLSDVKDSIQGYASDFENTISNLRKSYLEAIDENQRQNDEAIGKQRSLVTDERNQELGTVAEEADKAARANNLRLGVLGAGNSSAAVMSAKGIQGQTEKSRKQVLDSVAVSMADLDQKSKEVMETAKAERERVYEREKQLKEAALETYKDAINGLNKLKEKSGGWKQKDIDQKSEKYLARLIASINEISSQARNVRDSIHAEQQAISDEILGLRQRAALTFAPPEYEADKIDPGSTIDTGESEQDFFNPNAKDRKRIAKVKNILEQPDIAPLTA